MRDLEGFAMETSAVYQSTSKHQKGELRMANISIRRVSLLTVVIICLTGIPTPSAHAATELMATGELNNVDVTEAMKKGWESRWNTFEGI